MTKEDKGFLVKLATIMMWHIAWLIHLGPGKAHVDWVESGFKSFKEKCLELVQ
jgi:hypothetical protein